MIRKVQVIYRNKAVWSHGNTYSAVRSVPLKDKQVLWQKEYPKETDTSDVWDDMRNASRHNFFRVFYPAVIEGTKGPDEPTGDPSVDITGQSKWIQKRVSEFPQFYEYDSGLKKWHMSLAGYADRTTEGGGDLEISVSQAVDEMFGDDWLEGKEEELSGKTESFFLFVYPDRYDEDVRAMFELKVTFW